MNNLVYNFNEREFFTMILAGKSISDYYAKYACVIPEDFIHKYISSLNLYEIMDRQCISETFIKNNILHFDLDIAARYQSFTEEFIEEYADSIGWKIISSTQRMSDSFLIKHANKIDWTRYFEALPGNLMAIDVIKAADASGNFDWRLFSNTQWITDEIATTFENKIHFDVIESFDHLSGEYMIANVNKFDINSIISEIEVPENILRLKAKDIESYTWDSLTRSQNLSEGFIKEFADKLDWLELSETSREYTEEFMLEFVDRIYWQKLYPIIEKRISEEFKKNLIFALAKK